MHNVLNQIVDNKKQDLGIQKLNISLEAMKQKAFAIKSETKFRNALLPPKRTDIAIIGEIKLASPTHTDLGTNVNVIERAKEYESAHIDAISFITEKHYFKGDIRVIEQLKNYITLPILQKDFVIDPYQVYEAKTVSSDALLFIARLLDQQTLIEFVTLANGIGIEPVVEINDEADLEKAVATPTSIIAVNARNLENFDVDIVGACELIKKIPNQFIKLGFSGINSSQEVMEYKNAGAKGVLVGMSLMKAENIKQFVHSLQTI